MRSCVTLLCAVSLFLSGCLTTPPHSERTPAAAFYVDPQYVSFQETVLEALNFRADALSFATEKKMDERSDIALTRAEGDWVREMGLKYLTTREKLMKMAVSEANIFTTKNKINLSPYQGTSSRREQRHLVKDRTEDYMVYNFDPKDSKGEQQIFRIQMALASALILMDNYLVAIQPYNENSSLRYVLNYDSDKKRALQGIADSYASADQRIKMAKAIEFVDKVMAWRRAEGIPTSPEEANLYTITQSSIWYLAVKNGTAGNNFADAVANLWNRITLRGKRGVRAVSYGASMGFGNMVGLVETRKGYLYNMSSSEKKGLIDEMKPLDILMEKTPFRLTDKMIPGHYGHVAIWLGTEEQLKDLKVWDQIPAKIQAKIRSGHRIVEALRPGVEINTLEHFLNIDDFLVVRDNRSNITDEYRRAAVLQAVAQIGKEYDFNFDIHTHTRIVCSEIAYVVFKDVKWPVAEQVNRFTISPDNVVQLSVGNQRIFDPVILYYGGKRVKKDLPYSVSLLLKADDASYAEFQKFHNL